MVFGSVDWNVHRHSGYGLWNAFNVTIDRVKWIPATQIDVQRAPSTCFGIHGCSRFAAPCSPATQVPARAPRCFFQYMHACIWNESGGVQRGGPLLNLFNCR